MLDCEAFADHSTSDKDVGKKVVVEAGKRPVVDAHTRSMLTDEQLLLANATVRGYSLRDKKWFRFYIDNVKDIEWNDYAFDSLVAPKEQKDLILAFAEAQIKNRESFDDFIQGKGKGIIMLLSGPPGVGKTLTAESVAEAMRAPLYSIGAADLGSKASPQLNRRRRTTDDDQPTQLEKSLGDILEMCAKWGAGKKIGAILNRLKLTHYYSITPRRSGRLYGSSQHQGSRSKQASVDLLAAA